MLGFSLFFFMYAFGISQTSPIDASIILTLPPIVVLVLSAIFFKEKITKLKVAGILTSLAGALLIILLQTTHSGKGDMLGNIYVLITSLLYGSYLIFIRPYSKKYQPITLLKWLFLFGFIAILPFSLKDFFSTQLVQNPEVTPICVALYIGIFPTCISYILLPVAMKSLSSTLVSSYNYAIPFIATTIAIAMHQATLRWDEPIALTLVILGVVLIDQDGPQKNEPPSALD